MRRLATALFLKRYERTPTRSSGSDSHPEASPRRGPSPLTRALYARALDDFLAWCQQQRAAVLESRGVPRLILDEQLDYGCELSLLLVMSKTQV